MQRQDIHSLLHPYFDGELTYSDSIIFEEHLESCPDCSLALAEQQELRLLMESPKLHYPAPMKVRHMVEASYAKNQQSSRVLIHWNWKLYGIAASIAIMLLGTWIVLAPGSPSAGSSEAQEIVSAHLRSLMATHLFDVASTDQHTVKPWFTGRIEFSPLVKDLSRRGFQLLGGRLDYIADRPVAALVYQYRKHTINVFEWNSLAVIPQGEEKRTMKGFNIITEGIGTIKVWIVSDLNTEELDILANALR